MSCWSFPKQSIRPESSGRNRYWMGRFTDSWNSRPNRLSSTNGAIQVYSLPQACRKSGMPESRVQASCYICRRSEGGLLGPYFRLGRIQLCCLRTQGGMLVEEDPTLLFRSWRRSAGEDPTLLFRSWRRSAGADLTLSLSLSGPSPAWRSMNRTSCTPSDSRQRHPELLRNTLLKSKSKGVFGRGFRCAGGTP